MASGQIKAQAVKKKRHADRRTILVRVVAGLIALLMIGSVLLAAFY